MSAEIVVIVCLSIVVLAQAYFINLLVNKVMSRDFYEYKQSKNLVPEKTPKEFKVELPEADEDLGALAEFH